MVCLGLRLFAGTFDTRIPRRCLHRAVSSHLCIACRKGEEQWQLRKEVYRNYTGHWVAAEASVLHESGISAFQHGPIEVRAEVHVESLR